MEELLLRLRDSAELTLEELEDMQETLEEKDDELRTKITMVKDEKIKAELKTERQQVQEAMVLAENRIDEIKNRDQADAQGQSGLSAYREEGAQEQNGLSAYREEGAQEQSGLSAYREEDKQKQSDPSAYQEDTVKREKESNKDFCYNKNIADDYRRAYKDHVDGYHIKYVEAMKKIFTEVSIEAEKGNGDALNSLAEMYEAEFNPIIGRRLLNKAIAQGVGDSYYNMARMLRTGNVVEKDDKKAVEYFEKAVELGSLPAIWQKAKKISSVIRGENRTRDQWKEAMEYYKYYLENKYEDAEPDDERYRDCLYNYVYCGTKAGEEALKDAANLRKVLSLLLEHEGRSSGGAREIYGNALCNEKRFREAVSLWLEAGDRWSIKLILEQYDNISEAGDGEALDGILNEKANYTGQDYEKREIKGIILTWKGDRCEKDEAEAFKYYCQAAGTGYYEAKEKRDEILKKYQESNFIDTIVFFEESAEGGNADAYKYLGDLYAVDQRGNPHDYKKAMEYYRRGQAGTMREICEEQAEKMKELIGLEKRYEIAIGCVCSAVQERKEEGLNMIRQLAEKKFPAAVEYLKEHDSE